jgi:hypothetical protein
VFHGLGRPTGKFYIPVNTKHEKVFVAAFIIKIKRLYRIRPTAINVSYGSFPIIATVLLLLL